MVQYYVMYQHADSGFEVVRQELWRHTDRNPADVSAVTSMALLALEPFDDSNELIERLVSNLDPQLQGGLGIRAAVGLTSLGEIVGDPAMARAQRWGALSLLGVVAMTFRKETAGLAPDVILKQHRSQVSAYMARDALQAIHHSPSLNDDFRNAAGALLTHTDFPSENVAVELHDILDDLHAREQERHTANSRAATEDKKPATEAISEQGSRISEPYHTTIVGLSTEMRERFAQMDWLHIEGDPPAIDQVPMRDIYSDGERVALLADLTQGHHTLKPLMEDLMNDPNQSKQFWPQLAITINHYLNTGRGIRLYEAKVMTFAMKNRASNENIVRAYFTPLGTVGDLRMFGLIAAFRTKRNQAKVLRIISRSSAKNISEA